MGTGEAQRRVLGGQLLTYEQEFTKQSREGHRVHLAEGRHGQGQVSVQRTRRSWTWLKVRDQIRQGLAGHSRRLLEGFQQAGLMTCISFRKSSLCVDSGLESGVEARGQ